MSRQFYCFKIYNLAGGNRTAEMVWCEKDGKREHGVGMQIDQCGKKWGRKTLQDEEEGGGEENGKWGLRRAMTKNHEE